MKLHRRTLAVPGMLVIAALLPFTAQGARSHGKQPVPDFTRGDAKGDSHDWNLGATGAHGWMYGAAGHTAESRQILVTSVADGSPAAGVLQPGDVILGVGGKSFDDDARIGIAKAITAAEAADGQLRLIRWRKGRSEPVTLKLAVLGAYSETAPYECPKSKRIFDQGCPVIASRGLKQINIPNDLNALALLASGNKEYHPLLRDYAHRVADYHVDGFASWYYGYAMIFLAEYEMATGDASVMEGLHRLARETADGQSAVGTWGHRFARPSGNCNGYGCMNLPGLGLTIGMVLAREAGVKDPVVDAAIDKAAAYLRWYVDKGAIPYGDHQPWPGHEDNGKCSAAAVLFDLLGDREAATYYAAMSGAAYAERERGHTGNFFNMLWAMPGVSRCGPVTTGTYWKEQSWYYDLARGWDGSFGYQGSPIGEEEHGKYTNWDCTGAYLLSYALPLKSLCLTGKRDSVVPPLTAADTAEVIAAGRDYFTSKGAEGYQGRSVDKLLEGLSSWSPAVRKRSARALGRQGSRTLVRTLLKMLDSPDRLTRYGACEALGCLGPKADAAGERLRELLTNPDPWLQSLACFAIPCLGPKERKKSVSDLLVMTARENPKDPRRMAQRAACCALFAPFPGSRGPRSLLADSLEGVDRKLLYPAVESALQNEDGAARGSMSRLYGKLDDRDIVALLPSIVRAVDQLAPSNEMFGDGIRLAGLDLLSRLHIREAIPLCVSIVEPDRWGAGKRLTPALKALTRYGAGAKEALPALKEVRTAFDAGSRRGRENEQVKAINQAIATIETTTDSPKIVSLKDFEHR